MTITGNLAALNVGESVRALGHWVNHKQFGRQFAVEKFESVLPRTMVGIKKYLGSGLIKGIGDDVCGSDRGEIRRADAGNDRPVLRAAA